jgi:DNA processing protein
MSDSSPMLPAGTGSVEDGGCSEDERRARMAWARIAEPQDAVARRLIAVYGVVDALEVARRGRAGSAAHGSDRFLARLSRLDVDRDLDITLRVGARVVVPGDAEWPDALDDLTDPPWALWAHGPLRLDAAVRRSVAVVGARASTAYGEAVAAEIAGGLAGRGFTVVSGAAYGIDGAAHRAALAVEGRTVAVLACGVDRSYPASHTQLLRQIRAEGLVLSEVPPGAAPMRTRFLARNRLIAALGAGTVLVEAGLRSGARRTVSVAYSLDRPVGAVPGPVSSMVSAGCHEEIRRTTAVLVTDADEVADLVGCIGEDLAPEKRGEVRPPDHLDELAHRVWQSLTPGASMTVDSLLVVAGVDAVEAISALGRLERSGLAERRHGGWRRCRPSD